MPDGLYGSNLFKLVWLCNQYQCPAIQRQRDADARILQQRHPIFRITYT